MTHRDRASRRLDRERGPSLRNWQKLRGPEQEQMTANATLEMGWGRLIFGHTFADPKELLETIEQEKRGQRDITLYLRDPHVLLSMAPHRLFLDPSHTYRLWSENYRPSTRLPQGFHIRRLRTHEDAEQVLRIYAACGMVTPDTNFMLDKNASKQRTYFVAETTEDKQIIGTVMGADHVEAFNDPEKGASLWCLAADPQAGVPGVGECMVRRLCEHYFARGRTYVDLSVMHDNTGAIGLYEKLGFDRVPVFCVKLKNPINEPLFTGPESASQFNQYAQIIIDEARRRGIDVEPIDSGTGYFRLTLGGRSVVCRESLTEMTTAIAMSRCDDKSVTRRLLEKADLKTPGQITADDEETNKAFLEKHESVVVKPVSGEQGAGISVDVREPDELKAAIAEASEHGDKVLIEEYVEGADVRVIVINYEVVAVAVRKPPVVKGTGDHTVRQLVEKYNRRREQVTDGESSIPLSNETERTIRAAGYEMDDVLPSGEKLRCRKTANLHTGGTIHDVTDRLSDALREACVQAAKALDIPVVGLDLMVPDLEGEEYVIIEANERPGLANHEPAPTAEKFIDFLFPRSIDKKQ